MAVITEEPTNQKYSLLPTWGFVYASQDTALKRLAGAIIGQAAVDARKEDTTGREARRWLLSPDCAAMCDYIALDFRAVRLWVDSGCPDWRIPKKTGSNG